MQNKVTPVFLFLAVTMVIWLAATSLSSYLAKDFTRRSSAERPPAPKPSAQIQKLQAQISGNPHDIEAHLTLAETLAKESKASSRPDLLMEAVQSYRNVLELKPDQPDALLGLATVSLAHGILDQALMYYPRYLKVKPDDLEAKLNYALVLIQTDKASEAVPHLQDLLKNAPQSFPARFGLALAYRTAGQLDLAEKEAQLALAGAPNDEATRQVNNFLQKLHQPVNPSLAPIAPTTPQVARTVPSKSVSPAMLVTSFFQDHPMVGPKIRRITWPEVAVAKIDLTSFPIEQMPPFAKAKFIENIKQNFLQLPEEIEIQLHDEASNKMLSVKVGGKNAKEEKKTPAKS